MTLKSAPVDWAQSPRNTPPARGYSLALVGLLVLALFLPPGLPEARGAGRSSNRYLLIFETSSAMQRRLPATIEAVRALLGSHFRGRLADGDTLGVWTFNETLQTGRLPLQHWSAVGSEEVTSEIVGFLKSQKHRGNPRFDQVWPGLEQVIQASESITVVLFTSGLEAVAGTPFDSKLNQVYAAWRDSQQKDRKPFVTVLAAQQGKIMFASASPAPWPVEIPPPPAPKPPRTARPEPPKAEPPKPVVVGPPLIISGKKQSAQETPTTTPTAPPPPAQTPAQPVADAPANPVLEKPSPSVALATTPADLVATPAQPAPRVTPAPVPTPLEPATAPAQLTPAPAEKSLTVQPPFPVAAPEAKPVVPAPPTAPAPAPPPTPAKAVAAPLETPPPSPAPTPEAPPSNADEVAPPVAVATPGGATGSSLRSWIPGLILLTVVLGIAAGWLRRSRRRAGASLITRSLDRK